MPVLTALEIADDPAAWRDAGFAVGDDGTCVLGEVAVHLTPSDKRGIRSWSFDEPIGEELDGIRTAVAPAPEPGPPHPNGCTSIDHVVVVTPDVDRTVVAFTAVGLEAKRERRTDSYGAPMRQVFFRAGEPILELVGPDEPSGDRRAGFFGIAVTVADIDATKALLGEHVGDPKDAVQPGRRIATLRKSVGLTTAVAFMSPEPAR